MNGPQVSYNYNTGDCGEKPICVENGVPLSVASKFVSKNCFWQGILNLGCMFFAKHVIVSSVYIIIILCFSSFNRKSAKAITILISLLGLIYLLVFYLPGDNPSSEYFVAVIYPLQVRIKRY